MMLAALCNEEPVTKEDLREYWQDETELVAGEPPTHKHKNRK
jgi:hypothetical protein